MFPLTRKCFPLTGKCFPLTNFSNGKQTQESLESSFPENEFRETNMAVITIIKSDVARCRLDFKEIQLGINFV